MESLLNKKIAYLSSGKFGSSLIEALKTEIPKVIFITLANNKSESVQILKKLNEDFVTVFDKEDLLRKIQDLKIDVIVLADFGIILPKKIFTKVSKLINVHPSLLPKYRGSSPIISPLLAGEEKTGVSLIEMTEQIDAGPIYEQKELKIEKDETEDSLRKKLSTLSQKMIKNNLPYIIRGKIRAKEQNNSKATYTAKMRKEDAKMNWNEAAIKIERKIRAYSTWPKCFTYFSINNKKIRISIISAKISEEKLKPTQVLEKKEELLIGTSTKALSITKLQPENKKEMSISSFLAGYKNIKTL